MFHKAKTSKAILSGSKEYWKLTIRQVKKKFNGMGPETPWINWLPWWVRGRIAGADFSEVAWIHDDRFSIPNCDIDAANDEFLGNGMTLVDFYWANPSWIVRIIGSRDELRRVRIAWVKKYHKLCCKYGTEYAE